MSEKAPAAPAPEAAPAESSTPATPAPEAAPAPAPEQPKEAQPAATAPTNEATPNKPYFSDEQLAEMQKFIENNGGYDSAWKKMKTGISAPQQKAPEQSAQQQSQQQSQQQTQAPQNGSQGPRDGVYSMEELMVRTQFERYAKDPKYANIAEDILGDKVMKGLKDFNINVVKDGFFNDKDIRKYLDLYAASKPAKPTSAVPASSAPDYVKTATEGKVTTMDEANSIQLQNMQLKASGQPEHPLAEAAAKFVKEYYSSKKGAKK